ncbi:MAG: flagellar biosynthetic protein FliO, partial [Desulfovibrio sp.]|nr:flagellar biosynthetic protein FliO [Desulfovibrio sp.]
MVEATESTAAAPHALEQTATAASQLSQGMDVALQGTAQAAPVFTWGGYIQALGLLFVLVALFCLALWLARRFGRFRFLPRPGSLPRDALLMEAQLPLGPRKGLMVVRFLNKRLLLGVTEQHISLLSEEQAENDPDSANFETIMEDVRR